jgi:hypothetical protein
MKVWSDINPAPLYRWLENNAGHRIRSSQMKSLCGKNFDLSVQVVPSEEPFPASVPPTAGAVDITQRLAIIQKTRNWLSNHRAHSKKGSRAPEFNRNCAALFLRAVAVSVRQSLNLNREVRAVVRQSATSRAQPHQRLIQRLQEPRPVRLRERRRSCRHARPNPQVRPPVLARPPDKVRASAPASRSRRRCLPTRMLCRRVR